MEKQNTPIDITTISINKDLPQQQMIIDFLEQIHDPCDFLYHDYKVKIQFSENTNITIQDVFKQYYEAIQNQP